MVLSPTLFLRGKALCVTNPGISFGLALLTIGIVQALAGCGRSQAKPEMPKSCISIQQIIPEIVQVDDSGSATEPIHITIEAQGQPEDLRGGQVIYMEDGVQRTAISVGDLHVGIQVVTVPPGLHTTSSLELFEMSLIGPDGSETPGLSLPLNSSNSVPPAGASRPFPSASDTREDSDQPIATIEPDVDRQEAESIKQFGANDVGITSADGFARKTSGDDANLPPQIFTLRGVNFKDGMLVQFSTVKGGQRVEATSPLMHTRTLATLVKPSSYAPNNPSALMSAIVVVPVKITHDAQGQFLVRAAHAETSPACK